MYPTVGVNEVSTNPNTVILKSMPQSCGAMSSGQIVPVFVASTKTYPSSQTFSVMPDATEAVEEAFSYASLLQCPTWLWQVIIGGRIHPLLGRSGKHAVEVSIHNK